MTRCASTHYITNGPSQSHFFEFRGRTPDAICLPNWKKKFFVFCLILLCGRQSFAQVRFFVLFYCYHPKINKARSLDLILSYLYYLFIKFSKCPWMGLFICPKGHFYLLFFLVFCRQIAYFLIKYIHVYIHIYKTNRGDAMLHRAHKLPFFFNLGILKQQSGGCVLVLHCITYTFSAHILVLNLFGVWGTGPVGIPKGLVPNPCVRLLPLSLFSYTYYLCTSNTLLVFLSY